ncbi:hypothetical protein BGZ73_003360 [Actinomortierella ambigua]|nr:hypothetical protein BGZ73_003360 [Actinomortierella ambigua]
MLSSSQRSRTVCRSAMVFGLLALTLSTNALPLDLSSPSSTPYDTEPSSASNILDDANRIPFDTIRRPITIRVDVRPTEEQESEEAPSLALGVVDLVEEDDLSQLYNESHNLLVDNYEEVMSDSGPRRLQDQGPSSAEVDEDEMLQWPYVNLDEFESRSDEQQDEYEA